MPTHVRNKSYLPYITEEGVFLKPIPLDDKIKTKEKRCQSWQANLKTYERLHAHQTLSSARRFAHFYSFSDRIPSDSLDVALTAKYEHQSELFPEKTDFYYQPETMGEKTWRRLRNTKDIPAVPSESIIYGEMGIGGGISVPTCNRRIKVPVVPYRYNSAHGVLITGLIEKRDPNNVKLMNSSHHSSQTNPGYSRQSLDGNIYQY